MSDGVAAFESLWSDADKTTWWQSSETDDWPTPQRFFDRLNAEFGFDLDPCATAENAKCPKFFTKDDDGLSQPWEGTVFCNPPYGRVIGDWVAKAAYEASCGSTVVMLIPARTDTDYWHRHVMTKASEVRFVRGRLRFGTAVTGAPFPSAVIVFRPIHVGVPAVRSEAS